MTDPTQLEIAQMLFDFLQGTLPKGWRINDERMPHLTPEQAWTVTHYVQELHTQLRDNIERCDVCGSLFDTNYDGTCVDGGDPPYHFCDGCACLEKAQEKREASE